MELPSLSALHINYKEVMAMVVDVVPAVESLALLWVNKHDILQLDNQAAVGIINKGSSKNPVIMKSCTEYFGSQLFSISGLQLCISRVLLMF